MSFALHVRAAAAIPEGRCDRDLLCQAQDDAVFHQHTALDESEN
jgi:hypothetical protein